MSEYPDFERFDEVLFRLAQCLAYAGRYAEARPPIGRLQAEFPQSPFVEEAKKLEATFPAAGVPAGARACSRRAALAGQADRRAAERPAARPRLTSSVTLRMCVKTS